MLGGGGQRCQEEEDNDDKEEEVDNDKEKAVDANDVKETSLKVVEGKCSKNICHFWLTVTGELLIVCCQR